MAEKDYDRRMHTAEHILNSVMESRYRCGRSFRSHIEKKKSKCDYHLGKYDACPCIGPHVGSTSEVGKFVITTADHESGILRIRFRLE